MGQGGLRGSGPLEPVMLRPDGAGAHGTTHLQRMRELGAGGARSSFQFSAPSPQESCAGSRGKGLLSHNA